MFCWGRNLDKTFRAFLLMYLSAGCAMASDVVEPPATKLASIEAKGFVTFYDLSPDGKVLVYSESIHSPGNKGRTELVLIDLGTGKELRRCSFQDGSITGGVFSLDGKVLALGRRDKVTLWNVGHWYESSTLELPGNHFDSIPLTFSLDGKLLAGVCWIDNGLGHALTLWEVSTGRYRALRRNEHPKELLPDLLNPGGSMSEAKGAVFADDGAPFLFTEHQCSGSLYIQQWDLRTGKAMHFVPTAYWPCDPAHYAAKGRKGSPVPGSPASKLRLRTTPSGRIAVLPKYKQLPFAPVPYPGRSIAVVGVPPGEWLVTDPVPNGREKEYCRIMDFGNYNIKSCVLSPDGKYLVGVGTNPKSEKTDAPASLLEVWDVSILRDRAQGKSANPTTKDYDELWSCLSERHQHSPALRAMVTFGSFPSDAVLFLKEKIGQPINPQRVAQLLEKLDSPVFTTREQATHELEQLGVAVQPLLRRTAEETASPEVSRRIQELLDKLHEAAPGEELRCLRVIDILESVKTVSACELLQTLAKGGYGETYAEAAKKALLRSR